MIVDSKNLIPPNSGCWRPIELRAEPGTVVHAQFPAPVVYANHEMSHRVCDMLMGALATLVPGRVMACSQGTSAILALGGVDPRNGERYVSYETIKGGFGARPIKDGINAIASGISNTMNTPIEILEMSFPVRVERYELTPDSGGVGRWRGGLGVDRVWRILGAATVATFCFERTKSPPFGLHGGGPGAAARVVVIDADGAERPALEKGAIPVPAGAAIRFRAPGAGGYGLAAERAPERVHDDLLNGYVTPAAAAQAYGVTAADGLGCPHCRRA